MHIGVSKSAVCKTIREVTRIVIHRMSRLIDWPDNAEGRNEIAEAFFAKAKIPNVCGAIDGTLVPIIAPSDDEYQFVDRRQQHSINCMGVAGPDLQFYFFSSRWPGSVNDARVLRNSGLCRRFDDGYRPFPNAVILGDSAYPLNDWLIPMRIAATSEFEQFFK